MAPSHQMDDRSSLFHQLVRGFPLHWLCMNRSVEDASLGSCIVLKHLKGRNLLEHTFRILVTHTRFMASKQSDLDLPFHVVAITGLNLYSQN